MTVLIATGKRLNQQEGFTIIELMIALAVLAVLLTLCALVLLNLGKTYVKGTNQASAQNTARNVISDISNQIKLGGAEPDLSSAGTSSGVICIGTTRYDYIVGREVGVSPDSHPNPTVHALWRDTMQGSSSCPSLISKMQNSTPSDNQTVADSGVELIPQHMRLTQFSITSVNGLYDVSIGIAYGDNDLLCNPGVASDCDASWVNNQANSTAHSNHLQANSSGIHCMGGIGDQFCSVSDLSVAVARRLTSS